VLDSLASLDWICVAVLLASMLVGAWRGLAVELLSLLSWLAAFVLAQWLAPDVAQRLPMAGAAEPVRYAAGFVLVLVATLVLGGLLGMLVSKLLSAVGLGALNRTLGALFGLLRGVTLVLAAAVVVGLTPWKTAPAWQGSVAGRWSVIVLAGLRPILPQEFGKYLPST